MKTKTNPPEINDEHHKFGDEKSDGAGLTAPSAEGHPGVETEPTSDDKDSRIIEEVTPQNGEALDNTLPIDPSASLTEGTPEGSADYAMAMEASWKEWEPRLEKEVHFEEYPGSYGGGYRLLFLKGRIFVSTDDVAQAANYICGWDSDIEYTANDVLENSDIRGMIEVPGPEIPASSDGLVGGRYIPLEVLCSMLFYGELAFDSEQLIDLLGDFESRKACLRVAKLVEANRQEVWRRSVTGEP